MKKKIKKIVKAVIIFLTVVFLIIIVVPPCFNLYNKKMQNKVELYYTDYDINVLIGEEKEMLINDGSSRSIEINKEMEITDEATLNEFIGPVSRFSTK